MRRGHDVTLFAYRDSQTLAQLESVYPVVRLDPYKAAYQQVLA
ncbi:hypothetical protein [Trichocoleus sp. FACHB-69]|nr:hypothetical protein [Trichocoleus sp. FACHB-69]